MPKEDFENVPASVRKQAERADELVKQIQDEDPPKEDPPAVKQDADEPPAKEPEQETPPKEPSQDSFEHKYKVLQGKYNAEIPRLQQQISELYTEMSKVRAERDQLKQQPHQQKQSPAPEFENLNPDDFTEYGEEFGKLAKSFNALLDQNKQLQSKLNSIESSTQRVQQDQFSSKEGQFWKDLSDKVPKWEEINQNQDFLNWLIEEDPVSGMQRQKILENHHKALNAQKVAGVFNAWLNGPGKANNDNTHNRTEKPGPKNVQPEQSRADEPAKSNDKGKTWTRDAIKKHYDEQTRGIWEGREDEWKRIEREIHQAVQEGRVQ